MIQFDLRNLAHIFQMGWFNHQPDEQCIPKLANDPQFFFGEFFSQVRIQSSWESCWETQVALSEAFGVS